MKYFLIHLLILLAFPCLSQQKLHLNLSNSCSHDDQPFDLQTYVWEPDAGAQKLMQRICDEMGLKPRFDIKSASVPRATATIQGNKRLILYSENFILKINQNTGSGWAATGVFAHEIGHHLNNHPLEEGVSRPEIELEADQFSGHVLARMGATLEQAQAAVKNASLNSSSTHPPRRARLEAVAQGWKKGRTGNKETDSDGDGIFDRQDACPNEFGSRKTSGCPDYDDDGIPNMNDDCPYEAGTLERKGCPEPVVLDSDGDGVPDVSDKCRFTKGQARFEGCPDSDGDNLPDHIDKCPNEKGVASNEGCPATKMIAPKNTYPSGFEYLSDDMIFILGGEFDMGDTFNDPGGR